MTLGEKIYRVRTEKGLSQEAFGEVLGVSRQSVSKWETDQSVPELDKIVAVSDIFEVSTDYLLKNTMEQPWAAAGSREDEQRANRWETSGTENGTGGDGMYGQPIVVRHSFVYEYKSKTSWRGLPLVHVHFGIKHVRAKGVIAIGNVAQGIIAIGIVGLGIITFAPVSVGLLLAIGCIAAGGVAIGSLAAGLIAGGAVCAGIYSMGGVAVGQFTFGALAMGQQIAIGDMAYGNIALGFSEAHGAFYEEVQTLDGSFDHQAMLCAIDEHVSAGWGIFVKWMKMIIRMMAR